MNNTRYDEIWNFILNHIKESLIENGIDEKEINSDFDLMKSGLIDSIGFIQLISAIDEHFDIEIDFEGLDTEKLTMIGPLCKYIDEQINAATD